MGLRPWGPQFTQGRVMATSHQGINSLSLLPPAVVSWEWWGQEGPGPLGRLGSTESVQRKEPRSLSSRVNQLRGFEEWGWVGSEEGAELQSASTCLSEKQV